MKLRALVIISRPIAQIITLQQGEEQFKAIGPVNVAPVEMVRDDLRRVLKEDDIPVITHFLPWARLQDIQTALAEPYDVVHIVGHGSEKGQLLLEHDDATADFVSPERLARAMRESGVRLVLISACHSGKVGCALHQAGIPNVVMVDERYPIRADVAALFNRLFYNYLAKGHSPSRAFREGLTAVRTHPEFGDEAPPPKNPETGEEERRYGKRFDKIIGDDTPLVEGPPPSGYEDLGPPMPPCNVGREAVFVGREPEMVGVIQRFETSRMVTLYGPGGIGKTALAKQIALWFAERHRFQDGVFLVNAENARTPDDLLSIIARSLNFEVDSQRPWESLAAALTGRYLLLLDGANQLNQEAARQLDWLLKHTDGLHILATAYAPLKLAGWENHVLVDTLPVGPDPRYMGSAEAMFLAYITDEERRFHLAKNHFPAIQELCRELNGYPLGIFLEALKLNYDEKETPERLLETLQANMVEALHYAEAANIPEKHRSVGAALKGSYDLLDGKARELLAHIAVFPAGAAEALLKTLEAKGWEKAERQLRSLGLAKWTEWGGGRYLMLEPIRRWAQTTLPADELNAYRLKAARALSELATGVRATLEPGAPAEVLLAGRTAWMVERENFLAAIRWAKETGEDELLLRLVETVEDFLNLEGSRKEVVECQEWAVEAAKRAGSPLILGQRLLALGRTHYLNADFKTAETFYKQAIEAFSQRPSEAEERPYIIGEANTLQAIGDVQRFRDEYDKALQSYDQALQLFRAVGSRLGEANTLLSRADLFDASGRTDDALQNYEQALRLYAEMGDRYSLARGLTFRGQFFLRHEDAERAFQDWGKAILLALEAGPELFQMFFGAIFPQARRLAEERPTLAIRGTAALTKAIADTLKEGIPEQQARLIGVASLAFQVTGIVAALRAGMVPEAEREKATEWARKLADTLDAVTGGGLMMRAWVDKCK